MYKALRYYIVVCEMIPYYPVVYILSIFFLWCLGINDRGVQIGKIWAFRRPLENCKTDLMLFKPTYKHIREEIMSDEAFKWAQITEMVNSGVLVQMWGIVNYAWKHKICTNNTARETQRIWRNGLINVYKTIFIFFKIMHISLFKTITFQDFRFAFIENVCNLLLPHISFILIRSSENRNS